MFEIAAQDLIQIRKAPKQKKIQYQVCFISREDEKQIVTGVVADPENIDSYGYTIPKIEVWDAAYRFMELYQNLGVGHNRENGLPVILNDKIKILESWVTRGKTTIGGEEIPIDAWVLTVKINDNDIWEKVKEGHLTGFSFEAKAKRVPIN